MPICTLELLSLYNPSISNFFYLLQQHDSKFKPLFVARVFRWIITPSRPTSKVELLDQPHPWHLLLIYEGEKVDLRRDVEKCVRARWSVRVGFPAKVIASFRGNNERMLHHTSAEDIPPLLTDRLSEPRPGGLDAQRLELDQHLSNWISNGKDRPRGAVSMLNLLAFRKGGEEGYRVYGKRFAEDIGVKRGGVAKIVGRVLPAPSSKDSEKCEWDEMALAHYPSLEHFAAMLASEDYQQVNQEWRLPSLRDTCILCTSEVDLDFGIEEDGGRVKL